MHGPLAYSKVSDVYKRQLQNGAGTSSVGRRWSNANRSDGRGEEEGLRDQGKLGDRRSKNSGQGTLHTELATTMGAGDSSQVDGEVDWEPLPEWVDRLHGEVDYYLTQFLTGHGYFCPYLRRMGKMEDPSACTCLLYTSRCV